MKQLEYIQSLIYLVRGRRVMLDFDLAHIYQVETKVLNQAVKRNIERFEGEEFMFQLTKEEWRYISSQIEKMYHSENEDNIILRSQFVTAKTLQKHRYQPYAFTEMGVAMLSSVLKSEVAIQANRQIIKAFVNYRHLAEMPLAATYIDLRKQIEDIRKELKDIIIGQNEINESTCAQLDAIRTALAELQSSELSNETSYSYRPIGFIRPLDED